MVSYFMIKIDMWHLRLPRLICFFTVLFLICSFIHQDAVGRYIVC